MGSVAAGHGAADVASELRNVRVAGDLWERAELAAAALGTNRSAEMVAALVHLVERAESAGLLDPPRVDGEQQLF